MQHDDNDDDDDDGEEKSASTHTQLSFIFIISCIFNFIFQSTEQLNWLTKNWNVNYTILSFFCSKNFTRTRKTDFY